MMAIPALLLLVTSATASSTWDGLSFYLGDPHAHSGVSKDGWSADLGIGCRAHEDCGNAWDVFATARHYGLDWVGMSEHTNGSSASDEEEYDTITALSLESDDESGGFVTLPAAEVWFVDGDGHGYGHKNLLMFGTNEQLGDVTWSDTSPIGDERVKVGDCSAIETWMDEFVASFGDALLIPHHPALRSPMPTNWDCHSDKYELGVEVYSHFGNSLDGHIDFDAPKTATNEDGSIHNALDPDGLGLKMGFWGGSDFHGATPGQRCFEADDHQYSGGGFTVAVLDETEAFSRSSLYEAIQARHTYASSGPLLPFRVDYTVDGVSLGMMGDDLEVRGGSDLVVTITIDPVEADTITSALLETPDEALNLDEVGDGTWTITLATDALPAWLYPVIQVDGEAFAGDAWCEDGGDDNFEYIWASPSWIEVADHDDDGDGVSWADGDCDDLDASVSPTLDEVFYDGIDGDCLGGDDFDADGDGYDIDVDCGDTTASIYPGAADSWYDGVDSDCDGRDDYDQDEDGYRVDVDCDDTSAALHPDAADTWYDGIDTNCDGKDDYDRDRDGVQVGDDCNDTNVRVHPGAIDRPYDGIDADCDRRDDFDVDADGKRAVPWGPDWHDRDASRWRK